MSSEYKKLQEYSLSDKFQSDKSELKLRYKYIHQNILADIQRLQDNII